MNGFKALLFLTFFCGAFCSCKVTGQVSQKAVNAFLNDTAVRTGHAGISIYDPAAKKYLYNYNADKNFTPSSNVKLFTLYAGMKYLGDSIKAMKIMETDSTIDMVPTGDPTLLHPDFKSQRIINFLLASGKKISLLIPQYIWSKYAPGWAWDDYAEDFMAERFVMPLYGNVVVFKGNKNNYSMTPTITLPKNIQFDDFNDWSCPQLSYLFRYRKLNENSFTIPIHTKSSFALAVPFITSDSLAARLLSDTLKEPIKYLKYSASQFNYFANYFGYKPFYSRPVDSLFRPMMFNSDNFFAEQTLLMVSNEKLGYMNDELIIDTLLKTDFKDIPTKPRWVDGSGLSRYDLFSPKDFIYILDKLQSDFGLARMKRILPTGGQGTLTNYYESDAGYIYAKTGSMSNNVSLSGYLVTKKNRVLLFSVIINNFNGTGKSGRRAIEKLLKQVRELN